MMKVCIAFLAVALCLQNGAFASRSLSQLPVLGSPAGSDDIFVATAPVPSPELSPSAPLACAAAALQSAGNFSTLLELIGAASESQLLLDTLNSSEERATVLAPTDGGIVQTATELNIDLDELLTDGERITDILLYHILPSQLAPADLIDGYSFNTLYEVNAIAQSVAVSGNGTEGTVVGAGSSAPIIGELAACGFQVYPIDGLLLPA